MNKWELVFDFSKKGEQNFSFMPPSEFHAQLINVEGLGQPELVFGIPQRYGGHLPNTPPQSSAEVDSFGISTSATDAQKHIDSNEF